mgnify:CR=1 FL=1
MPRAQLVLPAAHDAPLTVTAVSAKLGVSASTLRSRPRRALRWQPPSLPSGRCRQADAYDRADSKWGHPL